MSRATCNGCKHYRKIGKGDENRGCHYCYDTGERRDCSAEACTQKELGSINIGLVLIKSKNAKYQNCTNYIRRTN